MEVKCDRSEKSCFGFLLDFCLDGRPLDAGVFDTVSVAANLALPPPF